MSQILLSSTHSLRNLLCVLPKANRQAEQEKKQQEAETRKLEEAKKNPKCSVCSVGV